MLDLYYAGGGPKELQDLLTEAKVPRLFSQLNDRGAIKKWIETHPNPEPEEKLFIDSGAHSAHTKGRVVDVDDYIEFINSIDEYVTVFAQVDKIPGVYHQHKTAKDWAEAPEMSWENYLYMRSKVKSPEKLIPVFHQGENFKWLENMLEFRDEDGSKVEYVGLSPRGDVSKKAKSEFLDKCFTIIKQSSNPNVKTHAFGMTSLDIMEEFPLTSADSTTWILAGVMGDVWTPYGKIVCSEVRIDVDRNIAKMPAEAQKKLSDYLESIGLTLEEVQTDYVSRIKANALFLINWAKNYKCKNESKITQRTLF